VHELSKQLEVTVHTAHDAYPGSDGQMADKPDELRVDGKPEVERREGKTRRATIDIADSVNV
jgi:hypothetical protein